MRRSFLGVVPVTLALLSSCTGMVQSDLDQTHEKLTALQELVNNANQNLSSLQQLVAELDDSHTVSAVSPVGENGYDLSFRDGKVVRISYGKNGVDGIVHPLGVKLGKDGLYYWTVDGEFMTDADGNPVRASASDGKDAIAPVLKATEEGWMISLDGGNTFNILTTDEEMKGVGVFKNAIVDPDMIRLVQWSEDTLKIARYVPVHVSFSGQPRDTVVICGGETLQIPFEVLVEGDTKDPLVVTSGTDGTYFSEVKVDAKTGAGLVTVTAPVDFTEGYTSLSATCAGASALKMIVFQPRVTKPADAVIFVPVGKDEGIRSFSYDANFDYVVSSKEGSWATALPNPEEKKVVFQFEENTSPEIRMCEITVSPKNNPNFVVTTFNVIQASSERSVYPRKIEAPAEGGVFDVWLTASTGLAYEIRYDWISTPGFIPESDFVRLPIHVDPLPEGVESRTGTVDIKRGSTYFNQITIVQKSSK